MKFYPTGAGSIQLGSWGTVGVSGWQIISYGVRDSFFSCNIKSDAVGGWSLLTGTIAPGSNTRIVIITATRDGTASLYVDGVFDTSISTDTWVAGTADQFKIIGSGNVDTCYIAAEQWISRVITADEITNLTNYYARLFQ